MSKTYGQFLFEIHESYRARNGDDNPREWQELDNHEQAGWQAVADAASSNRPIGKPTTTNTRGRVLPERWQRGGRYTVRDPQ